MKDVIIIGQGPAGLSAALYTCRAKLSTAILGKGGSSLLKAEKIENYFGLKDPLSGQALLEIGKKQVTQLGAQWLEEEVLSIGFEEGCFLVDTQAQRYQARSVILATGAPRKTIKIDGLSEFEAAHLAMDLELLEEAQAAAQDILAQHRAQLDTLAQELLRLPGLK